MDKDGVIFLPIVCVFFYFKFGNIEWLESIKLADETDSSRKHIQKSAFIWNGFSYDDA